MIKLTRYTINHHHPPASTNPCQGITQQSTFRPRRPPVRPAFYPNLVLERVLCHPLGLFSVRVPTLRDKDAAPRI
ncbi:hypothetical protein CDAR_312411 [Caerostris darwini]|uniref:Uncharacterized protein n=1 Tax=Caerostris darwini TaxID=1538125 RepID=A0AAV4QVP9_9ARAC|nr:hypothetical protein CDAR_312411 [Caerostris darwini]